MKVFVHNSAGTFNNVAGNQYNSGLLVPTGEINVVHGTRYSSSRGHVNNVGGTQYNLTRNGTTTSYVVPKNEVVSSISRNMNDGPAGLEINESQSSSDDRSSFRFPLSWKWKKFRGKEHPPKNDKPSKKSKTSASSLSSEADPPLDLDIDMLGACGEIFDQVKDISGDVKEMSSFVSQEMRYIQSRQSGVHHKRASDSSGSVDSALISGAIWSLYESMVLYRSSGVISTCW